MAENSLLQRIARIMGITDIVEKLSTLQFSDLQSLLMEVMARKTKGLNASKMLTLSASNRFVQPSDISQRAFVSFDSMAYQLLPETVYAMELAPVAPLGTNSVLTSISQKNILGTIRSVEVLADATTALAIECAKIRKVRLQQDHKDDTHVTIASSARALRVQRFDDIKGFTPHFRTFALATVGRDAGGEMFEQTHVMTHLRFYLSLIDTLVNTGMFSVHDVSVTISDIRIMEALIQKEGWSREEIGRSTQDVSFRAFERYEISLPATVERISDIPSEMTTRYGFGKSLFVLGLMEEHVVSVLRDEFPHIRFYFDLNRTAGIGYYTHVCFKITATNDQSDRYPICDGGMTDWTQKLLSQKKERLLTSGIGSELFIRAFSIQQVN